MFTSSLQCFVKEDKVEISDTPAVRHPQTCCWVQPVRCSVITRCVSKDPFLAQDHSSLGFFFSFFFHFTNIFTGVTACDRAGRNRQLCHLKTTTPQRHTRQLNITPPNKKETRLNEPTQDSRCKLEANGAYWTGCFVALPRGDRGGNGFSSHSPVPYCTPSRPTFSLSVDHVA